MTIASNKNTPRNSYTASAGQTDFTIGFEFFKTSDVKVYKNGTLLTYHADPQTDANKYKLTGSASNTDEAWEFGAGGTCTLGSTGASANDKIVIIRDITVERTEDFPPTGSFNITALNTQLDTLTSMVAEREQQSNRAIKLADTDVDAATLTLPDKATRASKVLEFDSDGDVATTLSTANLSTLAGITSEIATVAGISSNVTSVAGISSNVTSVAGISGHITTVAGISSAVTTVSTNNSNISTCATNISAITAASTHATNAANSATAAANSASAAAASQDTFDDMYLGSKSSDPSVDNDGDALTTGDLFFHSGTNNLRVYNGSAWEDAAISTNGFATTGLSIAMSVAL